MTPLEMLHRAGLDIRRGLWCEEQVGASGWLIDDIQQQFTVWFLPCICDPDEDKDKAAERAIVAMLEHGTSD